MNYYILNYDAVKFWQKMLISLTLFVMIILVVIFGFYNKMMKFNNEEINNLNKVINELSLLNEEFQIKISGVDKKKMTEQYIKKYIESKYKTIPESVRNEISTHTVNLSSQYGVSTELILGIMEVESSFNPMATSHKNARGLMQVMPEWSRKFGLKSEFDLHNISTGIESGIKVFKIHLEEENGNISQGLYRYVNKDKEYSNRVYAAMGRFVAFKTMSQHETENKNISKNEEVKIDKSL